MLLWGGLAGTLIAGSRFPRARQKLSKLWWTRLSSSLLPAAAGWSARLSPSSWITHASNKDQPLILQVLQRRFQVNHSFKAGSVLLTAAGKVAVYSAQVSFGRCPKEMMDDLFKFIESPVVLFVCTADTATETLNLGFLPLSRIGLK